MLIEAQLSQPKVTAVYDRFRPLVRRNLEEICASNNIDPALQAEMNTVAHVLPFRVNQYVLNELIDWQAAPEDPIFQLLFPNRKMLPEGEYEKLHALITAQAPRAEIDARVRAIRGMLNPHPAGQMELNVPTGDDGPVGGMQHKYTQTVLFFPGQGQTCHSYCSFCFRWAQFIGDKDLRFSTTNVDDLLNHLRANPRVTDVLITGGDPMVMKTAHLRSYIEPLLAPEFKHIRNIRIGTKSLTFWPHRYVHADDSQPLLDLFRRVRDTGRNLALMAHYNHYREMSTDIAQEAIEKVHDAGVTIRTQGPLLRHINDSAEVWSRMWQMQVRLGMVPYYMFVERDTGASNYFEVPLARAADIYRDAMNDVSGLARTARGPSMSATPGKVEVQGTSEINGQRVFVLRYIQCRDPSLVQRPFFARYDDEASWFDQLEPAFESERRFFEVGAVPSN